MYYNNMWVKLALYSMFFIINILKYYKLKSFYVDILSFIVLAYRKG